MPLVDDTELTAGPTITHATTEAAKKCGTDWWVLVAGLTGLAVVTGATWLQRRYDRELQDRHHQTKLANDKQIADDKLANEKQIADDKLQAEKEMHTAKLKYDQATTSESLKSATNVEYIKMGIDPDTRNRFAPGPDAGSTK